MTTPTPPPTSSLQTGTGNNGGDPSKNETGEPGKAHEGVNDNHASEDAEHEAPETSSSDDEIDYKDI